MTSESHLKTVSDQLPISSIIKDSQQDGQFQISSTVPAFASTYHPTQTMNCNAQPFSDDPGIATPCSGSTADSSPVLFICHVYPWYSRHTVDNNRTIAATDQPVITAATVVE